MKRKLNECDVSSAVPKNHTQQDLSTFSSLGLDSRLLQAIIQEGFSSPTLIQAKAIPLALEGKDLLARARTGSGKTAAYVLPILESILRRKANNNTLKYTSALILVPTRELAQQVSKAVAGFSTFCAKDIRTINITQKVSDAVLRSLLADSPDVVVATPARASLALNTSALSFDNLTHLVIDEADLVLSYGYDEDLKLLVKSIPKGIQTSLMSATLSADVDEVKDLFCRDPSVIELDEVESDKADIAQYVVKCGEDEKFLLAYVIFKLKLIKGKCIIFVGDIDRCYRLKLFFEQFGIKSCVLNSELPVNSRIHVVEEFNKNIYEIIIASDEHEAMGEKIRSRAPKTKTESHNEYPSGEEVDIQSDAGKLDEAGSSEPKNSPSEVTAEYSTTDPLPKKRKNLKKDKEYGVSRGIDFKNVNCVLNFDLPTSSTSYTHRIGRTARAGKTGIALSFIIPTVLYHKNKSTTFPTTKYDETVLQQITLQQAQNGHQVLSYNFNMTQVDAFRYRITSALSTITRLAIRSARAQELRHELLKSDRLKRHFEENPDELRHLRHDEEIRAVRVQPHLKHVPEYLMPTAGKAGIVVGGGEGGDGIAGTRTTGDVGFVPLRKPMENRIRKARMMGRGRGKGKLAPGRRNNPLNSFRAKGRA